MVSSIELGIDRPQENIGICFRHFEYNSSTYAEIYTIWFNVGHLGCPSIVDIAYMLCSLRCVMFCALCNRVQLTMHLHSHIITHSAAIRPTIHM